MNVVGFVHTGFDAAEVEFARRRKGRGHGSDDVGHVESRGDVEGLALLEFLRDSAHARAPLQIGGVLGEVVVHFVVEGLEDNGAGRATFVF